jgi:hypothetical protein
VSELLKLTHAIFGVWFLAALFGRWVTLAVAARATDVRAIPPMLTVSSRFEQMVRTVPLAVLALGIATAISQGRPFLGPLQGAPVDWLFASLLIFLSPLPLVPLVFLPRGRIFESALEEATQAGQITPGLNAAFRDRVVLAGHAYELGAMLVVLALMIAKPF